MNICSVEFTFQWSWGLVINQMISQSKSNRYIRTTIMDKQKIKNADVILSQQVTLLDKVKEKYKTLCRLGGNRSFDDVNQAVFDLRLRQLAECYAVIATNNHLYEIAKLANPNSYLIPNGLDIDRWKPAMESAPRPFTVGFAGNVATDKQMKYKGYDLIEAACASTGAILRSALYGAQQIPHNSMPEKFYHQIDCIIHPTLGEGCSNTLMEACACGVPIIMTRQAGYHGELMVDGEDCLFCERSAESIISCIERLRSDPSLRAKLAENSRKFAVEHHDVRIIAARYEEIFQACHEKTMKNNPPTPAPVKVWVKSISPMPFTYANIKRAIHSKFHMSSADIPFYSTRVKILDT